MCTIIKFQVGGQLFQSVPYKVRLSHFRDMTDRDEENVPANIIMCWIFVPILFLLPKLSNMDRG